MLSNKWTFSLKILVMVLTLGLLATPYASAGEFGVTMSVGTGVDASSEDGIQIDRSIDPEGALIPGGVEINIKFDKVVNADATSLQADGTDATGVAATDLSRGDFQIIAYTEFGGTTTVPAITSGPEAATPADGKNFSMTLDAPGNDVTRVLIFLAKHKVELADPRAELDGTTRKPEGKSAEASITIHYVGEDAGDPIVNSIRRVNDPLLPVTSATVDVVILLSEKPKAFTKDHVDVTHATWGDPVALEPLPEDPDGLDNIEGSAVIANPGAGATPAELQEIAHTRDNMPSTGRDGKVYPFVLTITPKYENKNDIVVKVKAFEDQVLPISNKYTPVVRETGYIEGVTKLTIKVGKEDLKPKTAGLMFSLPKDKVIPAGGYLVVAEDKSGSSVHVPPGAIDASPKAHEREPKDRIYNVIDDGDLPNLETFLSNGGTIGVTGPHALMITEIMWGSDASLDDSGKSQWIELYNAGAEYKTQDGDNTTYLIFYDGSETPPADLHDLVGTVDTTAGYWSPAGKGQSGASGRRVVSDKDIEATAQLPAVTPIISMYRTSDAAGTLSKGTLASSWMQSTPPSSNFEANAPGVHIGSPGAMPTAFPEPPPPEVEETPPPTIPVATAADIMISEIMVDTGDGRLPQWIEITNVSGVEKSLTDWSVQIRNDAADADAIGPSVSIDLSGTLGVGDGVGAGGTLGKALLLVAWEGRSSSNLSALGDRIVDVSSQVGERGRYKLISDMAFMIALVPPQTTGVLAYGDTAGNLDAAEAWELQMSETGRSSLIRRETDTKPDNPAHVASLNFTGTQKEGWRLASESGLVDTPATWYGSDEDAGTPGVVGGGPLPVELSHFRPARDKATGAVVITWATQSELNNAGFFIKRSNQRNGQFEVVNPTMIAGAGTTSEKQFYTYTDTTAQPNVVYYYQIEDVSLDGNRQLLTHGTRLRGHIGAAGKATTTWGDLKSVQ